MYNEADLPFVMGRYGNSDWFICDLTFGDVIETCPDTSNASLSSMNDIYIKSKSAGFLIRQIGASFILPKDVLLYDPAINFKYKETYHAQI